MTWFAVPIVLIGLALFASCDGTPEVSDAPTKQDRQVIEAFLLHMLAGTEYNLTRVRTNGAIIVLDEQTPGGNRPVRSELMKHPDQIGPGHSIPDDVQHDIVRRNGKQPASFTGLIFDRRITVARVPRSKGRGPPGLFEAAHPKGTAFIQAWLPRYSADRTQAVVRGWIGPAGGGQVTALMEREGDKWLIKWCYFQRF